MKAKFKYTINLEFICLLKLSLQLLVFLKWQSWDRIFSGTQAWAPEPNPFIFPPFCHPLWDTAPPAAHRARPSLFCSPAVWLLPSGIPHILELVLLFIFGSTPPPRTLDYSRLTMLCRWETHPNRQPSSKQKISSGFHQCGESVPQIGIHFATFRG